MFRVSTKNLLAGSALLIAAAPTTLFAHGVTTSSGNGTNYGVHENGIGADPDHDTNPATDTLSFAKAGDAALTSYAPPYRVIRFESAERRHGEKIIHAYKKEFGVEFSYGLTRQICEGQRFFQYDSMCTYLAAPSGRFAAGYFDTGRHPLTVKFAEPVCATAMAIYPTGGKQDERFEITLRPRKADGKSLTTAKVKFKWTKDTVRWRLMAGAYFLGEHASEIDVSMKSLDSPKRIVRFLIDDLAFAETDCEKDLALIAEAEAE